MCTKKEVNFATLRLFKALILKKNVSDKVSLNSVNKKSIKKGIVFAKELENGIEGKLDSAVDMAEELYGVDLVKANNTFHKSLSTVRDSSMEQLIFQQILHYMTTYGAESMGIYNENMVYVPAEVFDCPDAEPVKIVVIHGLTRDDVAENIQSLLKTGVALSKDSISDIMMLIEALHIVIEDVDSVKNKEVRIALYDRYDIVPKNPVEFLKFVVYKSIGETMLVNNDATIQHLKQNKFMDSYVDDYLDKYVNQYNICDLASIFYRYKNIWLAMKTYDNASIINKMRRLANKYHKPVEKGVLDRVTSEEVSIKDLKKELKKVTIFKKVSLLNSMSYRLSNPTSICYKIRNGRVFSTEFKSAHKISMSLYNAVLNSIVNDLKKNVENKYIVIPQEITYAFPTSEKQFCGSVPFGSVVNIGKRSIVGVHWENQNNRRIDLDLHMYNADNLFGWNSSWKSCNNDTMFTGDMTDAPAPEGATEAIYVGEEAKGTCYMLNLNDYTGCQFNPKYKLIINAPKKDIVDNNYIIDNATKMTSISMEMKGQQDCLGLLNSDEKGMKSFHFINLASAKSAITNVDEKAQNLLNYVRDNAKTQLKLNHVLELAGANIVSSKKEVPKGESFIDLSLEALNKTTLIELITSK